MCGGRTGVGVETELGLGDGRKQRWCSLEQIMGAVRGVTEGGYEQ